VPRTGGSILNLMDELVKVGQVMGYKMDGCMSNMTEIIESQGVKEVNFMALQETKMENMELFRVKMCWGNFAFDYVHSDSVGNSGGLEEVPLGGSAFTWYYKSASKMSKLDRFLVSENLIYSCSNINAITLERYLSDHRPILLREASFDYGPTPFRYFHYWNEMKGFNKVVEDAWREGPCDKTNAIKAKIREWNKSNMLSVKNVKAKYKEELEALEAIIDRGDGNEDIVNKRTEVVNNIQKFDKIHSSEMAQKAKVKWSIKGDKNTSFFHGVLNKKQSILNIRGIMVDGN
ncbi:RNA-directed DNA polymerase, eukaryota, partial [Tanacetum coccineum]